MSIGRFPKEMKTRHDVMRSPHFGFYRKRHQAHLPIPPYCNAARLQCSHSRAVFPFTRHVVYHRFIQNDFKQLLFNGGNIVSAWMEMRKQAAR